MLENLFPSFFFLADRLISVKGRFSLIHDQFPKRLENFLPSQLTGQFLRRQGFQWSKENYRNSFPSFLVFRIRSE